jgi:hypothetical protein
MKEVATGRSLPLYEPRLLHEINLAQDNDQWRALHIFLLRFLSCIVWFLACSGFMDFFSQSIFLVIIYSFFHQVYKLFKIFQWNARYIHYFQMPISFRFVLLNFFLKRKVSNYVRTTSFLSSSAPILGLYS